MSDPDIVTYKVYYAKRPNFEAANSAHNFRDTHTYVKTIKAESLDDAYQKMQAEFWEGDTSLIKRLGLTHTSMSVGDILVVEDFNEEIFEVANFGWNHLGTIEDPKVQDSEAHICPHCRYVHKDLNPEKVGKKQGNGYRFVCPECQGKYHYDNLDEKARGSDTYEVRTAKIHTS